MLFGRRGGIDSAGAVTTLPLVGAVASIQSLIRVLLGRGSGDHRGGDSFAIGRCKGIDYFGEVDNFTIAVVGVAASIHSCQ